MLYAQGKLNLEEAIVDATLASVKKGSFAVGPTRRSKSTKIVAIAADILHFASVAAVRGDHLDAVFVLESLVELVGVVSLVARQSGREFLEKASGKNFLNKLALGRRSALDRCGERKTVVGGSSAATRNAGRSNDSSPGCTTSEDSSRDGSSASKTSSVSSNSHASICS
ncbi:hypothetical protein HDF16_005465 [Granulicella aggregans]|uniref:Uncharacterized protein n=1 Tax=Granulicella aggregans TaxID=474949 RepID=A0A7W7ZIV1_9BACT|nr:hypothetical protein [Granulicella aggregans]